MSQKLQKLRIYWQKTEGSKTIQFKWNSILCSQYKIAWLPVWAKVLQTENSPGETPLATRHKKIWMQSSCGCESVQPVPWVCSQWRGKEETILVEAYVPAGGKIRMIKKEFEANREVKVTMKYRNSGNFYVQKFRIFYSRIY